MGSDSLGRGPSSTLQSPVEAAGTAPLHPPHLTHKLHPSTMAELGLQSFLVFSDSFWGFDLPVFSVWNTPPSQQQNKINPITNNFSSNPGQDAR